VPLRPSRFAGPLAAAILLLAAAAPARAADTVVAGNQIVQGKQCVGALCLDGESFSNLPLLLKAPDTPGLRLLQTGDGGFTPQTWDIAGNEANFFVRDLTAGSRLPFRIRPGAPTSSLDISSTGDISTIAMLEQNVANITVTGPVDGEAILAALRGLALSRYRINADTAAVPHVGPTGTAFRAAFATGNSNDRLAAADTAGIALAAVKALDARVSGLELTPGPKGDDGAPADPAATDGRIAELTTSNRKLGTASRRLSRHVAALKKRLKVLEADGR
jgi:hypothetical protein